MMRVPSGVHRAGLGEDAAAVLNARTGTWQWMNTATERIWSAALGETLPQLVQEMRAEGTPGNVETIVIGIVESLKQAGLLTDSGPGSAALPPPMPAVTAPATPGAEPGWAARVLARLGLVLALGMMRLPMRSRMRLLGCLRFLPPVSHAVAASAAAAVPVIRPAWWPGRIACLEVSLATVLTIALRGRRAHWIIGARRLPNEAHAWVWTDHGAFGLTGLDADDPRRPWTGVTSAPQIHSKE
ncbi:MULTISPECIES: lasso peptide biosynthesis B2 protein [Streptomyces]|uniref:Lasso peptide biosynthesis B2 protein n=2 Tax=Streptomyces TaxID=1883 RepID=A0ABV9J937_9ACTN